MRMSATCLNCGGHKGQGEFLNAYCSDCFSAMEGAKAAAAAAGEDPNIAARRVMNERAHTAHKNFVDPRVLDRKAIWQSANRNTKE